MSVKLMLLKSGETIISDAKVVISKENSEVCGYLLKNPHKVNIQQPFLISEEESIDSIQITLSPWIILTDDTDIEIFSDWVVTIVEPLQTVKEMYESKINGITN